MTDKLRDDLLKRADDIDPVLEVEFDTQRCVEQNPCGATEAIEKALYLIRDMRAALAAAPQPVAVMQYYYKENDCPAEHSRAETCICWHDEGKGPFPDLKNGDAIPMAYGSAIGLTWRARPADALLARGLRLPGGEDER